MTQKLIIDFTYETTAELAAKEIWPNFKSKHVCFPNTFEKTANQVNNKQQYHLLFLKILFTVQLIISFSASSSSTTDTQFFGWISIYFQKMG